MRRVRLRDPNISHIDCLSVGVPAAAILARGGGRLQELSSLGSSAQTSPISTMPGGLMKPSLRADPPGLATVSGNRTAR